MADNVSFKDLNSDTRATLGKLGSSAKWMKGFHALHQGATEEGALDKKTKELIALALGVSAHCNRCIGSHMASALSAGASREEIEEAVGVAVLMGGGPALMYGVEAIKALEELA